MSPLRCISTSGPMISCTSPPEQKLPPAPVITTLLTLVRIDEVAERVAQLGVGLERQRVLALGPVERDRRDLAVQLPHEVLRLETRKVDARRTEPLGGVAARRRLVATCRAEWMWTSSTSVHPAKVSPPLTLSTWPVM